jgi:hypothetical protein
VFDCDPTLPARSSIRPQHEVGICTDQIRFAFDVQVSENMTRASLRAHFSDGARTCAVIAGGDSKPLTAGSMATFTPVGAVVLSDDPHLSETCTLPVTTTRVVAQLWRGDASDNAGPVLTVEFPITYSFAMR